MLLCCSKCNGIIEVPCKTSNEADSTTDQEGKWHSRGTLNVNIRLIVKKQFTKCLDMCALENEQLATVTLLRYRVVVHEEQISNLKTIKNIGTGDGNNSKTQNISENRQRCAASRPRPENDSSWEEVNS